MLEILSHSYLVKMVKDGARDGSMMLKDYSQLSGSKLSKTMYRISVADTLGYGA
jgi:hypothetical protein